MCIAYSLILTSEEQWNEIEFLIGYTTFNILHIQHWIVGTSQAIWVDLQAVFNNNCEPLQNARHKAPLHGMMSVLIHLE